VEENEMRRVIQLLIPVVVLMGLVSACSSAGTTSTSSQRSDGPFTLVWGKETDPAGVNPFKAGDIHSWEIFSLVYEPLVRPNKDLSAGPGIATSWKETSPTSWRFQLRDGVKFSNGRTLTSADVVGTWQAYKKLDILTSLFSNIVSMTAAGPQAVDIKLSAKTPELPNLLEAMWILPGKELADGSFNPDKDLLGTGPYVAGKHTQGVSWTFTANPHYWQKDLPKAKTVEIKFIPDDASRLAAVRTGEVDFTMTANPDVQTILANDPNLKVTVQETTDLYFLLMNAYSSSSKVYDKRVRQAIALAIDRKQMIDTALGGIGENTGITPKQFADVCDPNAVLGASGRDVERAKALLQEAGVSNLSFKITLAPAFGALRGPQMAQVIQQNLKDIGVNVEVVTMEGGAWIDQLRKGTFDVTLNWYTGGGSPSYMLARMDPRRAPFLSKAIAPDKTTLAQLDKALSLSPGTPEYKQAAADACNSINELGYFIPLATKPTVIIHRADRISPALDPIEPVQMTFRKLGEFSPAS
jgi:peptide/nickel transport system substrate-binding protein